MKRFLLLWLLVITAILSSCDKKDEPATPPSPSPEPINKENTADPNIPWENISADDYELSEDGLILLKWNNENTQHLDMSRDPQLKKVTTIGKDAFAKNKSLKNINISNTITKIETDAFICCESLVSINIPNSVTSIGEWAFTGCSNLESIDIPNSVTSIEKGVFRLCTNLKSINISNSITSIGKWAFNGCENLKNIKIPSLVANIGIEAFANCLSLESIDIPNSVTSVEKGAFFACPNLKSITLRSPQIIEYTNKDFLDITPKLENIYVPANLVEEYKNAEGWIYFAGKIKAIED